jgi:hypothetical protein
VGLQPCWGSEVDNLLRHGNCVFDLVKCGNFDCFYMYNNNNNNNANKMHSNDIIYIDGNLLQASAEACRRLLM